MPIFGRSSDKKKPQVTSHGSTSSSAYQKQRSADIHDPILTAVQEAQPFERSNEQNTISLSPHGAHRDVFGNIINNPDRSNPARARDERPLDTIRTFEYACTGDDKIRDEMESHRIGWKTRDGFSSLPHYDSNPYAKTHANGNSIPLTSSVSVQRPRIADPDAGKKKRGLFGRKKKQ